MSSAAEKPTQGVYTAQAELHQPHPAGWTFNPALIGVGQQVQVLRVGSFAAAKRSSATMPTSLTFSMFLASKASLLLWPGRPGPPASSTGKNKMEKKHIKPVKTI